MAVCSIVLILTATIIIISQNSNDEAKDTNAEVQHVDSLNENEKMDSSAENCSVISEEKENAPTTIIPETPDSSFIDETKDSSTETQPSDLLEENAAIVVKELGSNAGNHSVTSEENTATPPTIPLSVDSNVDDMLENESDTTALISDYNDENTIPVEKTENISKAETLETDIKPLELEQEPILNRKSKGIFLLMVELEDDNKNRDETEILSLEQQIEVATPSVPPPLTEDTSAVQDKNKTSDIDQVVTVKKAHIPFPISIPSEQVNDLEVGISILSNLMNYFLFVWFILCIISPKWCSL